MRNILALIGLLVVGFAAIGWYCGWYKLSVTKSGDGGVQIETHVDTKKVADDSSAFFQKVGQVLGEQGKKGEQPAAAPGGTPGPATTPTTTTREEFQGGWFSGPAKQR